MSKQDLDLPTLSDDRGEVTLWDESDQGALINLVSEKVRERFKESLEKRPDYFELDEDALYRKLRDDKNTPTQTDHRLRLKFWIEYDRVKDGQLREMVMTNVIANVCSRELFYKHYLTQPGKVAWLMCPPVSYLHKAQEALYFGIGQLRDLLEAKHTDDKGHINTTLGALKLKIVQHLEDRIKGAVPQQLNVNQKSVSLTMSTSDRKMIQQAAEQMSEADMKAKLAHLNREERKAQHLPEPKPEMNTIDVNPSPAPAAGVVHDDEY